MSSITFARGAGGRCWDTEGAEYVDFVCGYGPVILGHADPTVTSNVCAQAGEGTLLPGPSPLHERLAVEIARRLPNAEQLLTFKTGSEAVAAAIRLARAHTGAERIIRVGFHGWHDQVISPYLSCHTYDPAEVTAEYPPGVPHQAYGGTVLTWTDPDLDLLWRTIRAAAGNLAAVVVDPVQLRPPFPRTVERLIESTHAAGGLLVVDESKTGFRIHRGGFQGLYGFEADLTVLSKALANGYPLAAVAGPEEIVGLAKSARIKGTYGPELIAISASLATQEVLERKGASEVLAERGQELIDRLNAVFAAAGVKGEIEAVAYHWPSMPYLRFHADTPAKAVQKEFYDQMQVEGILLLRNHMSFVCLAHSEDDVARAADAARRTIMALRGGDRS